MTKPINTYSATVESIDGQYATVTLRDEPKCDGCAIASACGTRPYGRVVKAVMPSPGDVKPGDRVMVKCPPSPSRMATRLWVVYPALLLIVATLLLDLIGLSDQQVAAWSLATVAVYYPAIFFLTKTTTKKTPWKIISVY